MLESGPSFTPGEIAAFLGILMFLFALIIAARKVFGHEPPLHKEYVTKADYVKDTDGLKAELSRHAARRAEIYERQSEHGNKLASLESETRNQTETLREIKVEQRAMRDRFDATSQRTLELLTEIAKQRK